MKLVTFKAPGLPVHGAITERDDGEVMIAINLSSSPEDRANAVQHELLHHKMKHLQRNINATQAEYEVDSAMHG